MKKNFNLLELLTISTTVAAVTSLLTFGKYKLDCYKEKKIETMIFKNISNYKKKYENPMHKITVNYDGDVTYYSKIEKVAFLDLDGNKKIDHIAGDIDSMVNYDSLYMDLRNRFEIE